MILLRIGVEMRIFKTEDFHEFAEHEGLMDQQIVQIIKEMERGLHNGNLGGNVFKKRIAIGGRGKRSGLRSIIAYKKENKAILIYGYAKNVRDDISPREKEAFKKLSNAYLCMDDLALGRLLKNGELIEVKYE